jgi:hypothetical protein
MKFNKMKMLPLVAKLGEYLNKAFDHYVQMKANGVEVDADTLAAFMADQMTSWDPELSGKKLLDPTTRKAVCRFVAGVAINIAK